MRSEEIDFILGPKSKKTHVIWYDRPVKYKVELKDIEYDVELVDYTEDREMWRIYNCSTREIQHHEIREEA